MIVIKAGKYYLHILRLAIENDIFIDQGEAICCASTTSKPIKGQQSPSLRGLEQTITTRSKAKGL